jgi:ATP-dependent helicase/nuclease subunit B
MEGDQLLPSRLLFAGDPLQAAERAEKLFGAPAAGGSAPVPSCGPLLDPWRLDARPPTRLRVSDFRRYLECPFRFYLGRVLGMERADDRKEELDARDYGEAVHHCLRELEEASWGGETDRGRIADLLQNKCDEWLGMRFGSRLPPAVAVQAVSIRNRLEAAAAVQAELAREGWRVVAAEVDVEMVLGDRTVSGRIDRIDCHEETGRYRILDYKTVDREKTPDKAHTGTWRDAGGFQAPERRGRRRRWTDLQLPLYAEMAASCGKAPPGAELGIFAIPAAAEDAGVLVWKEFDEEYRISAMAAAREVALRIGKGVFWPPAPHVPWDDFEFFRGPLAELVVPPEAGTEGEWE